MDARASIRLAQEPPFAIGAVTVEPAARTLHAGGIAVELEPRTMQVLVALAQPPGTVVGRQLLIDRCWDGRIVGEDAINRAISKLRRGLAEAGAPAAIETIPRIGYRLDPAGPAGTAGAAGAADAGTADRPGPPRPSRRRILEIGGAALVAGAAGIGLAWRHAASSPTARPAMPDRAREMFERGQVAFQQGSRDDNAQAIGFFEQAATSAPADPRIAGALALAYRFEQTFRGPTMLEQSTRRADAATARALALDPHNADAVAARSLHLPFGSQWLQVERGLRSGLREVPDSGVMNGFLAMMHADVGRTRAAIVGFERAMTQARFVPLLRGFLIQALLADGRVGDADRELDAAIALWPRFANLWWLRFWSYALTARFDLAQIHATPAPGLPIGIGPAQIDAATLAVTALQTRSEVAIGRALDAWTRVTASDRSLRAAAITLMGALGQVDRAIASASAAMAPYLSANGAGAPTPAYLFAAPLAPLRKDPRFGTLCDQVGLAAYWRESGARPDVGLPR